jgi:phage terminase large subunit
MRNVEVTNIFRKNYDAATSIIINRGGARSSKSYSIAQYLIYRLTNEQDCKQLISRKTMPALKITAYKLFIDMLKDYDYYRFCDHNKTDNILTYKPTNGFVLFSSIDNPEKIKSTEWNYIWMEEGNEFTYNDYMVLKLRLSAATESINQLIISLNPVDAFTWIKTEVVDKEEDCTEIISNYRDNPFLSQQYVDLLLSTKDPYYRKVYIDGEWGVLENLIFTNWSEIDELPPAEKTVYGCDFGYTDPTAIVECRFTDTGVYVQELLYRSNMTNNDLIEWIKHNLNTNTVMYCDSSEPQRITELRRADINVRPAKKGPDSVRKSIDTIRAQQLYVSSSSVNLIKELRSYKWQEDKNNNPKSVPADGFDHLVDATRYGIHNYLTNYVSYNIVTGAE